MKHQLAGQRPLTPLAWLEAHATQVLLQTLSASRRAKNRIILQYRSTAGEVQTVGGYSLMDAIRKAQLRTSAQSKPMESVTHELHS